MTRSAAFERALRVLQHVSPHYSDRALTLAMAAAPVTFVREALAVIREPWRADLKVALNRDDACQFLRFAAPLVPRSSGEFSQDLWALWESGGKRGGYFVEFGATNGKDSSNTYFLEKYMDWTGIVAEPNPSFAAQIRQNRSCFVSHKCVYSRSREHIEFIATNAGALSYIASIDPSDGYNRGDGKVVTVETVSLNDLLAEAKAPTDIDFMSVDTEGSEFEILSHFDFGAWNIKAIAVEHNHSKRRGMIFDLLTRNGYRRKWPGIGYVDDWYVRP